MYITKHLRYILEALRNKEAHVMYDLARSCDFLYICKWGGPVVTDLMMLLPCACACLIPCQSVFLLLAVSKVPCCSCSVLTGCKLM